MHHVPMALFDDGDHVNALVIIQSTLTSKVCTKIMHPLKTEFDVTLACTTIAICASCNRHWVPSLALFANDCLQTFHVLIDQMPNSWVEEYTQTASTTSFETYRHANVNQPR